MVRVSLKLLLNRTFKETYDVVANKNVNEKVKNITGGIKTAFLKRIEEKKIAAHWHI